jgi:hypothetical protein
VSTIVLRLTKEVLDWMHRRGANKTVEGVKIEESSFVMQVVSSITTRGQYRVQPTPYTLNPKS